MNEGLYIPGQHQAEALPLIVIGDDGREIMVMPEDFWQYDVDAMRCTPSDLEGDCIW